MKTISFLLFPFTVFSQLITTSPEFPNSTEKLTIYFDATQGNRGLMNCNCDVFFHAGVITDKSSSSSDWKYVKTTWGIANNAWKMTPVSGKPNVYSFTFEPSLISYFGVPANEIIKQLALVFRNSNGSLAGRAANGGDIFVAIFPPNPPFQAFIQNPGADSTFLPIGKNLTIKGIALTQANMSLVLENDTLQSTFGESLEYTFMPTEKKTYNFKFVANDSLFSSFKIAADLIVEWINPTEQLLRTSQNETISLVAKSYVISNLSLYDNNTLIFSTVDSILEYDLITETSGHEIKIEAKLDSLLAENSFRYYTPALTQNASLGDTVENLFSLFAPGKSEVYLIGNFNGWLPSDDYLMKLDVEKQTFWLTPDLPPDSANLLYQFLVDGNIKIADPYSTLVLDPIHDPFISEEVFPGIPTYPYSKTSGIISWINKHVFEYDWKIENFNPPPKEKLIIYELLIRDFLESHSYKDLIDTLSYLKNLGVNAIELMPINEFEGNISWGYNPSFHLALDKYYGSPIDFKRFVDSCHAIGIAVILDVVYNHAFNQSPLYELYKDSITGRPSAQNPWFNPSPLHPFNVGNDFNHDSPATKKYVEKSIQYWLKEFKVDGYRFDLSKGFTQRLSFDDSQFSAYDINRINILKNYAKVMRAVNPNAYVILEHFADIQEEKELAADGMLLWSGAGLHNEYLEAAMGYSSNLIRADYRNAGYSKPSQITYIESHDEERLVYKNVQFGNQSFGYNVKNLNTALERAELAATFFLATPGPKMMWQFGELGYDFSINYCPDGRINAGCRTDVKPIVWEYPQNSFRKKLYNIYSALHQLRAQNEVFHTSDFEIIQPSSPLKGIHLRTLDHSIAMMGNFGVIQGTTTRTFPFSGKWYEFFSGDSLMVAQADYPIQLNPGEYRLYSSKPFDPTIRQLITSSNFVRPEQIDLKVYPNPTDGDIKIEFNLNQTSQVTIILFDGSGKRILELPTERRNQGIQTYSLNSLSNSGYYWLRIQIDEKEITIPVFRH
jgi:1,4-alpha-glucan branching enzyme